jgi:hypothetical protein
MTMDDAMHGDDSRDANDEAVDAAAGRAGLLAQLRQLEDFAARTVSEGDALPPQATEMILHLREIVQALDGLTASMGDPPVSDGGTAFGGEMGDAPRGDRP